MPMTRTSRSLTVVVVLALAAALVTGCNPEDTPLRRSTTVFGSPICQVGVIGDSLTMGSRDLGGLAQKFNARGCQVANIDARKSRPTSEGAAVAEAWRAYGVMPRILVVALGTNDCNGPAFAAQVRRILAAAGPDRPVVWVNVWRPRCDRAINDTLFAIQEELNARPDGGNLWIVNHWAWVFDNRWVLARDGIHFTTDGYRASADRIVAAVMG